MTTRDLDRWLRNKTEPESVHPPNTSHTTTESCEFIMCPTCLDKAERIGAQDSCDVYVCKERHVIRLMLGWKRTRWALDEKEEA